MKLELVEGVISELQRLTALTPKGLPMRMLKLTNEVGELAQAVDIAEGNPGTAYRGVVNPVDDVLEEAVDVLLVAGSLLCQLMSEHNITEEAVAAVFAEKSQKWARVIGVDDAQQ